MGNIRGSKLGITICVMASALMAMIDISIVNVALSDIRASFGTPIDQIGWISTGYMMANIVVIPLTGWFQRRFGFRRYFAVSILLFTGASVLCGLAWNLPSLVAFRVLQGVGGGAIIPTAQAILFGRYPVKEHTMAGALFGIGAITGPLLGPTIGGYLIDALSWHWIFFINVPVGIAAALMALRFIEEPGFVADDRPIDLFGIGLLAAGMASLQYVLEEGNREGWTESTSIIVFSAVAVIALFTFVVHVLEVDHPIVDLRVFLDASYTAGTGINFLVGLALFSGSYLFSLYCGAVMRYTALNIGLVFLAAGAIQLFLMPLVGRFGGRVDGRYMLGFAVPLLTLSLYMNGHLTPTAGYWDLVKPQMTRAVALTFTFVPLSVITLSGIPLQKRGNATGLFNLTRELGGSIGTAWMSTSLDAHIKQAYAGITEHVSMYSPVTVEQLRAVQAAMRGPDPLAAALTVLHNRMQLQALVLAFNRGFLEAAVVFLFAFALVFVLRRPSATGPVDGAH